MREEFNTEAIKASINSVEAQNDIDEIEQFAKNTNSQFEAEMIEAEKENDDTPNEIKEMTKYYKIKDAFAEYASNVKLPIFVKKVNTASFFEREGAVVPIDKKMLSEGFDLNIADKTINFARTEAEARMIDLDSQNEYTPVAMNINSRALETIRNYFNSLPTKSKKEQLSKSIAKDIKIDEISEPQIANYIYDVIEKFAVRTISKSFDASYGEYIFPSNTDNFDAISVDDQKALEITLVITTNQQSAYEYEKEFAKGKRNLETKHIDNIKLKNDGEISQFLVHPNEIIKQTQSAVNNKNEKAKKRLAQKKYSSVDLCICIDDGGWFDFIDFINMELELDFCLFENIFFITSSLFFRYTKTNGFEQYKRII